MAPSSLSVAVACLLCATLLVGGNAADKGEPRLHVFSSLNRVELEELPPYPAGMELSLTCQTAGNRDAFWVEKKGTNDPEILPSEPGSLEGIRWTVYTTRLAKEDHDRKFMCMKDSSTMQNDVNLNVVDQPSDANVSSSINAEVEAEFRCVIEHLSPQLELCWFKGDQELQCQKPDTTSSSTETSVTTNVLLPELLEKSHSFLCKPKLRSEVDTHILTNETLQHFNSMFALVSKELKMTPHGLVDCDAALESGAKIVVVKSENTTKTCYQVVITEHDVAIDEAIHKAKETNHEPSPKSKEILSESTATPTTPPQVKEAANTDRHEDENAATTVFARVGPLLIPVLQVLAFNAF